MPRYVQTLQLIAINGAPLAVPDVATQLIDTDSDESDIFLAANLTAYTDSSDSESDYTPTSPPRPMVEHAPTTGKRGRRKLTDAERAMSSLLKKQYFKTYYKNNLDKYKYTTYDYTNSCVYKLCNTKTNKIYIGSTILPLNLRLKRHATCIRNPQNTGTYKDMAAVSRSGWTIEPIVKVKLESKAMLNYLETIYISHYQDIAFNRNKRYTPDVIECVKPLFHADYLPAPTIQLEIK
jgi:hypothetical protein